MVSACVSIVTFTGFFVNDRIKSWIGRGIVAEKKTVCRSARRLLQDRADVVEEAHVEHAVGLVQDDHLHLVQDQRAAVEVVHDAARRADDDLRAIAQAAQLAVVGLAAVDRNFPHALLEGGELRHFLRDLHGQLARGAEDETCGARSWTSTLSMAGSAKAAVLPEPVCELPTTSAPESRAGIACDWMWEASSKPIWATAFSSSGRKAEFGERFLLHLLLYADNRAAPTSKRCGRTDRAVSRLKLSLCDARGDVAGPGIEPGTRGFSVRCSTS